MRFGFSGPGPRPAPVFGCFFLCLDGFVWRWGFGFGATVGAGVYFAPASA